MGRYVPKPGIEEELASSLGMRNLMDDTTRPVAAAVRQSSPRRSGRYRRSITTGVTLEDDGWHGRVGSTDFAWHMVEYGSVNNPTYAPLRRGLEKTLRRTRQTPKGRR